MAEKPTVESALERLSEAIARDLGVIVYDIVFRRSGPRWKLQVFLDREGTPISLGDCEAFSRQLSRELDVADLIPHSYDLEVSSPGIERSLRVPAHWRSAIGREVQVRFRDGFGATRWCRGTVASADESIATIVSSDGTETRLELGKVLSARIHVEW